MCIIDWDSSVHHSKREKIMPPKPKYTKEQIIDTALVIVSKKGMQALTARELGNALNISASPIFTVFDSMQEVQDAVKEAAMRCFEGYVHKAEREMPLFKQIGMQMIFMSPNNDVRSFDDIYGKLGGVAKGPKGVKINA